MLLTVNLVGYDKLFFLPLTSEVSTYERAIPLG
jgi:hypothetical protein